MNSNDVLEIDERCTIRISGVLLGRIMERRRACVLPKLKSIDAPRSQAVTQGGGSRCTFSANLV